VTPVRTDGNAQIGNDIVVARGRGRERHYSVFWTIPKYEEMRLGNNEICMGSFSRNRNLICTLIVSLIAEGYKLWDEKEGDFGEIPWTQHSSIYWTIPKHEENAK
jgi:hypothetical protein